MLGTRSSVSRYETTVRVRYRLAGWCDGPWQSIGSSARGGVCMEGTKGRLLEQELALVLGIAGNRGFLGRDRLGRTFQTEQRYEA